MDFVFLSEADTHPGETHYHRFHDLVQEVLLAEKVGFDAFGTSEQHVAIGTASMSAPECFYPYMMPLTNRIRFMHLIALLPVRINHALRVAERVATQDILSNGRIELGTGRGNTTLALRAFEVDPRRNKLEWEEGIDLIRAALLQDPFSFVGEIYKVPPRSLAPKALQDPLPPMSVACSSPDSHVIAARKGLGCITAGLYMGLPYIESVLSLYDQTFDKVTHDFPVTRKKYVSIGGGVCVAATDEEARRRAKPLLDMVELSVDGYGRLAKMSKDYEHMGAVTNIDLKNHEYMLKESGGFIVGSPESCIEQVQRYVDIGADALILRIDSMPLEHRLETINMFGRYVIPHFKRKGAVVRKSSEILEGIRKARPAHYARVEEWEKGQGAPAAVVS